MINEKLRMEGSIKFFNCLSQSFIANISRKKNKSVLDLTLDEILKENFCKAKKEKVSTLEKYKENLSVLNYLKSNKDISEKSNFDTIKNMKYYEIYDEYLYSKEFKKEISNLKKEWENDNYIKPYIIKDFDLIDFFYNHD